MYSPTHLLSRSPLSSIQVFRSLARGLAPIIHSFLKPDSRSFFLLRLGCPRSLFLDYHARKRRSSACHLPFNFNIRTLSAHPSSLFLTSNGISVLHCVMPWRPRGTRFFFSDLPPQTVPLAIYISGRRRGFYRLMRIRRLMPSFIRHFILLGSQELSHLCCDFLCNFAPVWSDLWS